MSSSDRWGLGVHGRHLLWQAYNYLDLLQNDWANTCHLMDCSMAIDSSRTPRKILIWLGTDKTLISHCKDADWKELLSIVYSVHRKILVKYRLRPYRLPYRAVEAPKK